MPLPLRKIFHFLIIIPSWYITLKLIYVWHSRTTNFIIFFNICYIFLYYWTSPGVRYMILKLKIKFICILNSWDFTNCTSYNINVENIQIHHSNNPLTPHNVTNINGQTSLNKLIILWSPTEHLPRDNTDKKFQLPNPVDQRPFSCSVANPDPKARSSRTVKFRTVYSTARLNRRQSG